MPTHTVHYGFIKDQEEIIDEVMVSVFHAPRTFTAENSAEISFHGSPHIAKKNLGSSAEKMAREPPKQGSYHESLYERAYRPFSGGIHC